MSGVQKYSKVQILLHWGILLLMIVSYFSGDWVKEAYREVSRNPDAVPGTGAMIHVWFGIAILALVAVRVVARVVKGAPELPETGKPLMDMAAKLAHLVLYFVMIVLPVSGLIAWFGGVQTAGEAHEIIFNVGMAVVILHVVAALYHQIVLKDNLMARMKMK